MATELVLIRHGHAVRINGDYVKAPLTTLGQKQAISTGKFLRQDKQKLDALYTSPLRRTKETSALISSATGLAAIEHEEVQEVRIRELPLLIVMEFFSLLGPVEKYLGRSVGKQIRWPVGGRVSRALLEIVAAHPNERVGVVAHSGVISSVLAWLVPEKRWKWWRHTVGNCSITRVVFSSDGAKVLEINSVDHLRPEVESTQPPTPSVELIQKTHQVSN